MLPLLLRKTLYSVLVVWGVVTLVFILFNLIPGDPARMMMGQQTDEATLTAIKKDLGLDRSLFYQYLKYINDFSPISLHNPNNSSSYIYLDRQNYPVVATIPLSAKRTIAFKYPYLRRSYQSGKTVSSVIGATIPNTLILAVVSMLFATVVGVFLGIIAALKRNSWIDRTLLAVSALGMSLPSFLAAIIFGWIFAFLLGDFTGLNLTGNLWEVDDLGEGMSLRLKNLILPAFTLGIRPLAVVTQLARSSMLEVLSSDYIRTAKAKGLSFVQVIWRHALKNSLNPVVSAVSGWFAGLMAGVVFIEYIFGWKGMGYVMVNALSSYDVPLVMGSVVTFAIIFVVVNFLVDLAYAWIDPRVRFR